MLHNLLFFFFQLNPAPLETSEKSTEEITKIEISHVKQPELF